MVYPAVMLAFGLGNKGWEKLTLEKAGQACCMQRKELRTV